MKLEDIILDINKNLVIINSYNLLQVLMFIITKNFKTNAVVLVKEQLSISSISFLAMFVKNLNLSFNRDLIFKLKQLDTLTLLTHIVDHNISHIIIRNNISHSVILSRYTRLNKVLKYEAKNCF